ncbi:hypothetical protein ABH947_005148 [Bacillus sp. RC206]
MYCCFIKSNITVWLIPFLVYCPFGEEGTGVIKNDMGNGCYQFSPCICEAGNHSPEEVERRRHGVMAELREIHQLKLEGK